jgi:hypothetical protein
VFDVNATTLKLISTTEITLPEQAANDNNPVVVMHTGAAMPTQQTPWAGPGSSAPQLQVAGRIAYVLQQDDHLAVVELTHGKLLSHGKLPDTMTPISPTAVNTLFRKEMGMGATATPIPVPPPVPPTVIFNPGGPVAAIQTVTLVGTVHQVHLEGGFWAFDDRNGQKYSLIGDKLKELLATPKIDGARVRLTGVINNAPDGVQYGNGAFTVTEFQVMTAE